METVVMGANGTLGRLVAAGLAERGHHVTAIARAEARDPVAIGRTVPRVIVDCAGASTLLALGKGWRGYRAVDTPIGLAAVEAAKRCDARLVYVGTHFASEMRATPYVDAHERVVTAMREIDGCVVRATGFFSVFLSFLPMARRGFMLDIGRGQARTNPIDERDLADLVIGAALDDGPRELAAGGPEIMHRREIYERVAAMVDRRVRIVGMPRWLAQAGSLGMRGLHPRIGQFAAFACGLAKYDVIAPVLGTRRFDDYCAAARTTLAA
ncbi:MAG: hypothetical protein ABI678_06960 [Kofleriaceae bacterium]